MVSGSFAFSFLVFHVYFVVVCLGKLGRITKAVPFKIVVYLCFAVWCLIHGASMVVPDVAVRCAEEVLLPCKALHDSSTAYQTASWYKVRTKSNLLEQSALLSCLILACLIQSGLFYEEVSSCQCSRYKAAMEASELTTENRSIPHHCGQTICVQYSNCSWFAFMSNFCWLPGIKVQVTSHIQPDKHYSKEKSFQSFSSEPKMVFKHCNVNAIVPWLISPQTGAIFFFERGRFG